MKCLTFLTNYYFSGLNIINALQACFYETKYKEVEGIDEWYSALKKIGLSKMITNPEYIKANRNLEECPNEPWYFLGKMV